MASILHLWVSSSETHSEQKLSPAITIGDLKAKLEPITGVASHSQALRLQRGTAVEGSGHGGKGEGEGPKEVVANMDDDTKQLGFYGARDWMTIRVDNTDPTARGLAGQFTDVSRVEKFELTADEYEKRSDTVLAYKQRLKLGRFAPQSPSSSPAPEIPVPANLVPGARCEVALSSDLARRGTVRFVGPTEFGAKDESVWVGVEWDEPLGKNDGLVDGKRYFQAAPMSASFVRPDKVTIGDFPELDPFAEDDEEMEM